MAEVKYKVTFEVSEAALRRNLCNAAMRRAQDHAARGAWWDALGFIHLAAEMRWPAIEDLRSPEDLDVVSWVLKAVRYARTIAQGCRVAEAKGE